MVTERTDAARMAEPGGWTRSRPVIPGYGVPEDLETTLDWTDVAARLAEAKNYWVITADAGGVPHAVPVWGAFIGERLYFSCGGRRTVGNLERNPHVTIHLESGDQVVITEGRAERMTPPDAALVTAIDDQYHGKYDWRPTSDHEDGTLGDGWWELHPTRIFAWTSFPADATRWIRDTPERTSPRGGTPVD